MTTTSRFVPLRGLRAAVFATVGAMCAEAQATFPFEFETSFGYAIAQSPLDSYFAGALACSTPLTLSPRVDVVRGGGAPAHRIARPSGTGLFGVSLAWLPEGEHTLYRLAVGSPDPLAGKGEVFVFSGEAHQRITSEVERAVFGASMCVLASKGDRAATLAIGAPRVLDPERPSSGFVLVCDSRTLEVKFTASPAGAGEFFGAYLVEGGDVDRDGLSELLVGEWENSLNPWAPEKHTPSTAVWMVSGSSGAPLWHRSFEGSSGTCVATFTSCTDRNDDGIRDVALVLAQPKELETTPGYWNVRFVLQFLDGATGKLIERIEPHAVARAATWNASIVEIGDVSEDSTPDLAIGTATSRRGLLGACGCVTIVSGVDGKVLLELDGGEGGFAVGWSLARLSFASDFGLAVGAPDCGLAPGYVARFRGREFQRLSSLQMPLRE